MELGEKKFGREERRAFLEQERPHCDSLLDYTTPWSSMASATLMKPAILAPAT